MKMLLDTMVVSELRKVRRGSTAPNFALWAERTNLSLCYISVITVHEIERGVRLTEHRDPFQGLVYRSWLDDVLEAFHSRIWALTTPAAIISGGFHVPNPAPLADSLIAGTAADQHATIVTRNTKDFSRFGVPLLDPWDTPTPPYAE
ncbi:MAG: type II toxin-antitoxin system VapC family toxin [Propionibacteriaceae bacterium]|jgi:predicted nucleic acid-binding protein|nr:type II toxin-antitoxin system VapC family toxin [Propionibacteriaceae bacterium]